ncbi:MAG: tetratricopeptide repeat protein [Tannerella sp.]|jgi:tetratricopeptide (TPR) repeat protein|nr:tetratricopeptide repeat protein [Tannerella sp.]
MDELLQRYYNYDKNGTGDYFDIDEIIDLLDYFGRKEIIDHHSKVLSIGQKFYPDNNEIQIHECKSLVFNNQHKQALDKIKLIDDLENESLRLLRCECYCAMDQIDELKSYLKFIGDSSGEDLFVVEETYSGLAHLLREKFDSKYAYELVEHGLKMYPKSVLLVEELCEHFENQERYEEAIELGKELIDENPYCTEYWYSLGRLYSKAEDYEKAIEAFDFALVCDKDDMELYVLKAFCYFIQGDLNEINHIYSSLLGNDKDFIIELNRIMKIEDDFDRAYTKIKMIIKKYEINTPPFWRFFALERVDRYYENFLLRIACFFPKYLLFLLCREFILIIEGHKESIENVLLIVQDIYDHGSLNKNISFDTSSTFCISPLKKVRNIFSKQTIDLGYNISRWSDFMQVFKSLLDGDINLFCEKYSQLDELEFPYFLESFLPMNLRPNKENSNFLKLREIYRNNIESLSIRDISSISNPKNRLN